MMLMCKADEEIAGNAGYHDSSIKPVARTSEDGMCISYL